MKPKDKSFPSEELLAEAMPDGIVSTSDRSHVEGAGEVPPEPAEVQSHSIPGPGEAPAGPLETEALPQPQSDKPAPEPPDSTHTGPTSEGTTHVEAPAETPEVAHSSVHDQDMETTEADVAAAMVRVADMEETTRRKAHAEFEWESHENRDISPKVTKDDLLCDQELAAAIFTAASNQTHYCNTLSNSHATKITGDRNIVRVEIPDAEFGRKTVDIEIPEAVLFPLYRE